MKTSVLSWVKSHWNVFIFIMWTVEFAVEIVSGGTNPNRSAILQSRSGMQVSLKTLNINFVCHAPHSIIRICGIACWRRNVVTISTKWTQREVEKLIMETCLFVYVVAVVFWYATNKTDNFEDVFCILVFHHGVKCLQVKDLYAYIVCINSVLILYTQSVYDYSNKEKLLFLTLNVVIYALSHVQWNLLYIVCRLLKKIQSFLDNKFCIVFVACKRE